MRSCVCPICRRRFPTEQALSQHCDQAHDVNTDQQRHLRAQQLEARLKKKSTKAQAKDVRLAGGCAFVAWAQKVLVCLCAELGSVPGSQ